MAGRATRLFALLLFTFVSVAYAASGAELWPGTKPLRFESGSAAGGIVDLVARELSRYLATSLGVSVAVEDRPGAGGNIAAAFVAKAEPDGHLLLVTSLNQAVNPTLLPNPGFDYARDLVPVSMAVTAKMLLVAAPAFPAKTITDVIAIAKQKPKSVSIAISPIGTSNYLGAEMLAQYADIDLTFVPYNGAAQALPDLIANRVNLMVASMSTTSPQVRNGKLKALAVLSPQRSPLMPEIPTSVEAGLPEMQIEAWFCIMTTGGAPAPVVARLDAEVAKILTLPQLRDFFAAQGVDIFYLSSQQLGEILHAEAARFRSLLKHSRVVGTPQ